MALSVDDVLDSFEEYLRRAAAGNLKSFQDMRKANRESAVAEAIVFQILQALHLDPQVSNVFGGGADFQCTYQPNAFNSRSKYRFVVEATTLEPTAVERNTGWRNEPDEEISGGFFKPPTKQIADRIKYKVRQLSQHKMPRVLAIVSTHPGADVLFSNTTVEGLLLSNRQVPVPSGGGTTDRLTDRDDSPFLSIDRNTGRVAAERPTVSAVLLVSVSGDRSSVVGILHPKPHYPLDMNAFPGIPFASVDPWPVLDGRIQVKWVVANPSGREFTHFLIVPTT